MQKAHVIEVFVVAPAHDHILNATAFFVDAQLAVVPAQSSDMENQLRFGGTSNHMYPGCS